MMMIEKAEIQPTQDLNITCIEDLYGILSPYVNVQVKPIQDDEKIIKNDPLFGFFSGDIKHRLSDEEIEDAIVQGATERAMRSKSNYQ